MARRTSGRMPIFSFETPSRERNPDQRRRREASASQRELLQDILGPDSRPVPIPHFTPDTDIRYLLSFTDTGFLLNRLSRHSRYLANTLTSLADTRNNLSHAHCFFKKMIVVRYQSTKNMYKTVQRYKSYYLNEYIAILT